MTASETNRLHILGRQRRDEMIAYIEGYVAEHGFTPTFAEIQAALGYRSVNAVRQHIAILVAEGRLSQEPADARCPCCGSKIGGRLVLPKKGTRRRRS